MSKAAIANAPPADALPLGTACAACGGRELQVFYEAAGVPTNSCILLDTSEAARIYPRGNIRLAFCAGCGFISNVAFDPVLTEYSGRYEETQGFSPTFQSFHRQLAADLVERHALRHKDIIEIGCGKGEFLKLLCDLGENRGLGFDPGYSKLRGEALGAARFDVVQDFFSHRYADRRADFVACKMTLEHIARPHAFLDAATRTVRRPGGVVFLQVPESMRILKECAYEDIYYEHCSYFTAGSLGRLLERLGFDVVRAETEYGDQYLTVEATPRGTAGASHAAAPADLDEIAGLVASFPERVSRKLAAWAECLDAWRAAGKRVVIWGSGSKGVSFLTTVPNAADTVEYAVDINPYREGYFMAGTAQEIVAPQALERLRPDVVVVMNRVYVPEISRTLSDLGLSPEIAAL